METGTEIIRAVAVEAREGYRIWVRFSDGVEGEADLSHLVGRGVYKAWDDHEFFGKAHIRDSYFVAWDDEVDLSPDTLYINVTGKPWEELYPSKQQPEITLANAEARGEHTVWVRFSDGTESEIDISSHLASASWELEEQERLSEDTVAIAPWGMLIWEGKVEICPTQLYQQAVNNNGALAKWTTAERMLASRATLSW